MRRIYRQANTVLAWLDQEVAACNPAFEALRAVGAHSQLSALGSSPDFWNPVCEVLKNAYWSRVWVQQEVSNASTLRLFCKAVELSICSVYHILRLFDEIQMENLMGQTWWDWAIKKPSIVLPKRFGHADSHMQPFQGTTLGTADLDLLDALAKTNTLGCTDDRDRVYGIMYLVDDCLEGDIAVDYNLTVPQVYTNVAESIVSKYGSTRFLAYATLDYGSMDVRDPTPTWVPDWRRPLPRPAMGRVLAPLVPQNKRLSVSVSNGILSATAAHVGTVARSYRDAFERDLLSQSIAEFMETCGAITRAAISLKNSTEDSRQAAVLMEGLEGTAEWHAVIRTLGGLDNRDRSKQPDLDRILYMSAEEIMSLYRLRDNFDPSAHQIGKLLNIQTDAGEDVLKVGKLLVSFAWWNLVKHIPFLTDDGRPGLAPKCAVPGDEIWLIPGCEVPVMLRQEGANHKVVGEAYLDGANFWEPVGGIRDEIQEGNVVNGHAAQVVHIL